jgi:hypothetical protein
MKMYGGVKVDQPLLTSALGGDEESHSYAGRFTPGERAQGTHWIGNWVGLRTCLDAMKMRKMPCPFREWNPGLLACIYSDWVIPVLSGKDGGGGGGRSSAKFFNPLPRAIHKNFLNGLNFCKQILWLPLLRNIWRRPR